MAQNAQVEPERFMSERAAWFAELSDVERAYLKSYWPGRARPKQLLPPALLPNGSRWTVWLLQPGRGFGKTETGANACHDHAASRPDAEIVIVTRSSRATDENPVTHGRSGLLKSFRPGFQPIYNSSRKRVTWPNGSYAQLFSAEEPDQIRGPNATMAWCEELSSWSRGGDEAWANIRATMRTRPEPGQRPPFVVITSTPKPTKLFKRLAQDPFTWVTQGKQSENIALADEYLSDMQRDYGGTRLGRQELDGELLTDAPGALWKYEWFEEPGFRCDAPETLTRVVVAVDPAVTSNENSDETGIVVAGKGEDDLYYVLADLSGKYSSETWAHMALAAYAEYGADTIIAEVNNGGDLVERNLRAIEPDCSFAQVRASRGKAVRAEPIAALYERGRVRHVGPNLEQLEVQLCDWSPLADSRGRVAKSPDRLDALVWAMADLIDEGAVENGPGGIYGAVADPSDLPM